MVQRFSTNGASRRRSSGEADHLVRAIGELARPWLERIAATGVFDNGGGHPLNAETFDIPARYPLAAIAETAKHRWLARF